jgi:hypothetical protein
MLTPVVMAKVEAIGNANWLLLNLHGADVEKNETEQSKAIVQGEG